MKALRTLLVIISFSLIGHMSEMCAAQKPIRPLSPSETMPFIEHARQCLLTSGTRLLVTGTIYNDSNIASTLNIALSRHDKTTTAKINIGDLTKTYVFDNCNNEEHIEISEINDHFVLSLSDISNLFLSHDSLHYIGPNRLSGRPVHEFEWQIYQSNDTATTLHIKAAIDAKYYMPLKVEYLNHKHRPVRRVTISSFKKNNGTWSPKTITLSDISNRKKTTIEINNYRYSTVDQ